MDKRFFQFLKEILHEYEVALQQQNQWARLHNYDLALQDQVRAKLLLYVMHRHFFPVAYTRDFDTPSEQIKALEAIKHEIAKLFEDSVL